MPNHKIAIHLSRLLLAGLWLLTTACQAGQPVWQGVWSGTIGKSNITACLAENGKSAYRYQKFQTDIPLALHGNDWEEPVNGTVSGIWKSLELHGDQLQGNWQNPKSGRVLPIQLTRVADGGTDTPCESSAYLGKGSTGPNQPAASADPEQLQAKPVGGHVHKKPDFMDVPGWNFVSIANTRDGKALVALRHDGEIFRSTDDGVSWSSVRSGSAGGNFNSMVAEPNGVLVAVGGSTFARSTDDGVHWAEVKSVMAERLYRIVAQPNGVLVAAGGNGVVVRSIDDGARWSVVKSGSEEAMFYRIVAEPNGVLVAMQYDGEIVRSVNGGAHWSEVKSGTDDEMFNDILAAPNGVLVAVGNNGEIVRSTDGGAHWSVVESGTAASLKSIVAQPNGILVVVGDSDAIVRSTDGGAHWSVGKSGTAASLNSIVASKGILVAGGGRNIILRSTDGGISWHQVRIDDPLVLQLSKQQEEIDAAYQAVQEDTEQESCEGNFLTATVCDDGRCLKNQYETNLTQLLEARKIVKIAGQLTMPFDLCSSFFDSRESPAEPKQTITLIANKALEKDINSSTGYDLNLIVQDGANGRILRQVIKKWVIDTNKIDPVGGSDNVAKIWFDTANYMIQPEKFGLGVRVYGGHSGNPTVDWNVLYLFDIQQASSPLLLMLPMSWSSGATGVDEGCIKTNISRTIFFGQGSDHGYLNLIITEKTVNSDMGESVEDDCVKTKQSKKYILHFDGVHYPAPPDLMNPQ